MKLIAVTSPSFFVEETAILETLFEEGLDMLHIRKPDSDPVYCERLLTLLSKRWRKRIIVEDHFFLKSEYDLKGIHLSQRNPTPPNGYDGLFTRSCYTIEEVDYWKRRSHKVIAEDMDDERLHRYVTAEVIDNRVAASQLTSLDDVRKFRSAGFGGVVAADILWNRFDFHKSDSYKDIITLFRQIRKACG
ncbi:MAG: thiamine phosphate synthase [Bacteroidaceae bacterium]|nr:thiamine phosphate synthase [Bacteroidaceae bacterium]